MLLGNLIFLLGPTSILYGALPQDSLVKACSG